MVDRAGEAKDADPQLESTQTSAKKREDEDVGESVEKESVKAAGESAVRDTELDRTRSVATDVTATTQATAAPSQEASKRGWYQRLNPLRWGAVPPVPAERTPCPESTAGFFSLLTFSWMSPLMTVSLLSPSNPPQLRCGKTCSPIARPGIRGPSSAMISGLSIPTGLPIP